MYQETCLLGFALHMSGYIKWFLFCREQSGELSPDVKHTLLSDEQRQFIEAKMDPKEFIDRLKQYQTDYVTCVCYSFGFT